MATKQEPSSDRKSSSAVSGQSSAPQRWIPVWMSLVGLVVGAWLTYSGSSAVFHRYQVWWRGGAFVWDGEEWDQCFNCVVGLGLIFFMLRKEGEFRTARLMRPYGERRRWAHEAADRVIGTMQIDATPVDPQDVAQRLGLHLVAARDLPQAAVWCHHPAQPVLMVDESATRNRLRFGMAHAIGHYLRESECADDGAEEFCCPRRRYFQPQESPSWHLRGHGSTRPAVGCLRLRRSSQNRTRRGEDCPHSQRQS